jgi:pSer/pThr/pTyr-binding forkhead associated (FHA) protein
VPGENQIGRETGQVTFPADRYVSARHARIAVGDFGLTLTDLGSSNGTFVRLVGPTALHGGDQLLIGGQLLRLDA